MKITKYTHATVLIDDKILVDPGKMSPDAPLLGTLETIIFTHSHSDHYDPDFAKKSFRKNPNLQVFASPETAENLREKLPDFAKNIVSVNGGVREKIWRDGDYELSFFGARHAHILDGDTDRGDNIGIVISDKNSSFVYPGDSFDFSNEVKFSENYALALPVSGPWLKLGESVRYFREISRKFGEPVLTFPTHDALNNTAANRIAKNYLSRETTNFAELKPDNFREI